METKTKLMKQSKSVGTSLSMLGKFGMKNSLSKDKLNCTYSGSVVLNRASTPSPTNLPSTADTNTRSRDNSIGSSSSGVQNADKKIPSLLSLTYLRNNFSMTRIKVNSNERLDGTSSSGDEESQIQTKHRIYTTEVNPPDGRIYGFHPRRLHVHHDKFGNECARLGVVQSVGVRDQDRYDIRLQDFYYLSVYDGHGTSAHAADMCMDKLYDAIIENSDNSETLPSDTAIAKGFETIDNLVCSNPLYDRSGACAVALFVDKEESLNFFDSDQHKIDVKVAWVGDCRALYINSNWEVQELTKDHRVDENQNELERILSADHSPRDMVDTASWNQAQEKAKAEGKVALLRRYSFIDRRRKEDGTPVGSNCVFAHSGGVSLQVTRSIGDKYAARSVIATPEITKLQIRKGEFARFVLASDGLFDVFSSQKVAKFLSKYPRNPRKAAKSLVKKAKQKRLYSGKGIDDITVVIFDINPLDG